MSILQNFISLKSRENNKVSYLYSAFRVGYDVSYHGTGDNAMASFPGDADVSLLYRPGPVPRSRENARAAPVIYRMKINITGIATSGCLLATH
jgi:hypothetical protein